MHTIQKFNPSKPECINRWTVCAASMRPDVITENLINTKGVQMADFSIYDVSTGTWWYARSTSNAECTFQSCNGNEKNEIERRINWCDKQFMVSDAESHPVCALLVS